MANLYSRKLYQAELPRDGTATDEDFLSVVLPSDNGLLFHVPSFEGAGEHEVSHVSP